MILRAFACSLLLCLSFYTGTAQTDTTLLKQVYALKEQGKYTQALNLANRALRQDSVNFDYLVARIEVLEGMGKFQELFEACTHAIELHPTRYELYGQRGNVLAAVHQFDYAINDFTLALQYANVDSVKVELLNNRASAKMGIRQFKSAHQDLMTAYRTDSNHLGTLTNLSVVSDEIGEGDKTLQYLLRVVAIDSNFIPAYANIGFKYQRMGEYATSNKYYDKVLQLNPEEALGYSNRSFNRLKLGDIAGAEKDIEKAIKLYPIKSYAYRTRALIQIEKKQYKKACADLALAVKYGFTTSYGEEVEKLQEQYCNQ
jgi:tetratricopeptide (TPR) repeat protein